MFDSWFWHASVGLPVMHLDDEGSPYRFSLGGGAKGTASGKEGAAEGDFFSVI